MGTCSKRNIFPEERLLFDKKRERASWVWMSILNGRDTLMREGVWKLGDGSSIRALSDPWIYIEARFKLEQLPSPIEDLTLKVASSITPSKTWNVEMLQQIGTPHDLVSILQILIPSHIHVD